MSTLTAGQRLLFWRKKARLSIRALEKKTGIGRSKICRLENDQQSLKSEEMELIVATLGLTVARFYGSTPTVDARR